MNEAVVYIYIDDYLIGMHIHTHENEQKERRNESRAYGEIMRDDVKNIHLMN